AGGFGSSRLRGGMLSSLRVRNYRLFAGGQLISLTGTWMQRVAQDWLVLQLTNSGAALGVVTALQFLPSILLGLWGGVLADRMDKRRLLLVTQTGLAGAALLLGVLDLTGVVAYWHVLVLAFAVGAIGAVDTPARQSFAVEMVGSDDLANAVGINSTIFNAGRILGPAAAGLLITGVGTGWAFVVNAASSVAVLAGLAAMRTGELHPSPALARAPGQMRAALAYVRGRLDLMLAMALVFVVGTFGMNFQITTAILAKQVFDRGADGYGLLSTALAVGACIGAVIATRRTRRPSALFLVAAAVAFGLIEVVCGMMPTFGLTAVLLVPAGLAMLTVTTAANSSVQMGTDPVLRGRVMALYLMCFMGGTPVGAPVIGWVSGVLGPRWGMIGGGALTVVFAVLIGLALARRRDMHVADVVGRLEHGLSELRPRSAFWPRALGP
ncbi:MAG: MFS transporter, partial [bacterium]